MRAGISERTVVDCFALAQKTELCRFSSGQSSGFGLPALHSLVPPRFKSLKSPCPSFHRTRPRRSFGRRIASALLKSTPPKGDDRVAAIMKGVTGLSIPLGVLRCRRTASTLDGPASQFSAETPPAELNSPPTSTSEPFTAHPSHAPRPYTSLHGQVVSLIIGTGGELRKVDTERLLPAGASHRLVILAETRVRGGS